jgi:histidinol-phosphate aminotransferase
MSTPAPRPGLSSLAGYYSPQVTASVRLNSNESPVAPPDSFVEKLKNALDQISLHRYPDRQVNALREALADREGVLPSEIFCANGSDEVLQSLFLAYGGPGRSVLIFEPTYALHSEIARITGTQVITAERSDDFTLSEEIVSAAITSHQPDIVMLCSPNNPTGLTEPVEALHAALDSPSLVLVDEAYGQFASYRAHDVVDPTDRERLVTIHTFSKTWALAGLRLGYAVAPSAVVENLELVAMPYHLSSITQRAGLLALEGQDEMEARVLTLKEERQRIEDAMAPLAVKVWPSEANFILFRPTTLVSNDVWQGLLDRSVLVRNFSDWPRLDGCLRVTVGTPKENEAFITALREVVGQ